MPDLGKINLPSLDPGHLLPDIPFQKLLPYFITCNIYRSLYLIGKIYHLHPLKQMWPIGSSRYSHNSNFKSCFHSVNWWDGVPYEEGEKERQPVQLKKVMAIAIGLKRALQYVGRGGRNKFVALLQGMIFLKALPKETWRLMNGNSVAIIFKNGFARDQGSLSIDIFSNFTKGIFSWC